MHTRPQFSGFEPHVMPVSNYQKHKLIIIMNQGLEIDKTNPNNIQHNIFCTVLHIEEKK